MSGSYLPPESNTFRPVPSHFHGICRVWCGSEIPLPSVTAENHWSWIHLPVFTGQPKLRCYCEGRPMWTHQSAGWQFQPSTNIRNKFKGTVFNPSLLLKDWLHVSFIETIFQVTFKVTFCVKRQYHTYEIHRWPAHSKLQFTCWIQLKIGSVAKWSVNAAFKCQENSCSKCSKRITSYAKNAV